MNQDLMREVGGLGLLGVTIPEEYGGAGMDATAACIIHHEVFSLFPSFKKMKKRKEIAIVIQIKNHCPKYIPWQKMTLFFFFLSCSVFQV